MAKQHIVMKLNRINVRSAAVLGLAWGLTLGLITSPNLTGFAIAVAARLQLYVSDIELVNGILAFVLIALTHGILMSFVFMVSAIVANIILKFTHGIELSYTREIAQERSTTQTLEVGLSVSSKLDEMDEELQRMKSGKNIPKRQSGIEAIAE